MKLRKGVKSNYGNELTSADAVFSWQRALTLGGTGADKAAKTWLAENAAGFGPRKVKSWVKGQSLTYERRDDYYGKKSGYKTVRLVAIPNSVSRLATLKKGDVDIALGLSPSQIKDAAKTKGIRIANFKGNSQE